MMKKLLSLVVIAAFGVTAAFAQCTPDNQYTAPGIYPDSATGLPHGVVNQAYSAVITVVIPTDTVVSGLPVTIDSITATGVTGLPTGFQYQCSDPLCNFDSGTKGCLIVTGNPTAEGVHPLEVYTKTYATSGLLGPLTQLDTVTDYSIVIGPAGVADILDARKFEVVQNAPNPFTDFTTIAYSTPSTQELEFTVFDVLGKVVFNEKFMSERGVNQYRFNAVGQAPGVYMYTLSNGTKSYTKRMIISNK